MTDETPSALIDAKKPRPNPALAEMNKRFHDEGGEIYLPAGDGHVA